MTERGGVAFQVPVGVAYEYLADPRNRPEWQSSLRRVTLLDEGDPRPGMRWLDHTVVGLTFRMEITGMTPGGTWSEEGAGGGFTAFVTLHFTESAGGCEVRPTARLRGRGVARPMGRLATRAGLRTARSDLRRAARILAPG